MLNESPWVRWRLLTLETRMESWQTRGLGADDASVFEGGEGTGGAAGASAPQGDR